MAGRGVVKKIKSNTSAEREEPVALDFGSSRPEGSGL